MVQIMLLEALLITYKYDIIRDCAQLNSHFRDYIFFNGETEMFRVECVFNTNV